MDYFLFIFREIGSSYSLYLGIGIGVIFLYTKLIKPDINELNYYRRNLKKRFDELPSKDDIKEIITQSTQQDLIDDDDLNSFKLTLSADIQKLENVIKELKNDIFEHHEELIIVKKISEDIKKNCTTMYEVIDKTLNQLESKGILDKLERIDYKNLNEIQISANELTTLATILNEALNKSRPPRKLDRV